MFVSCKIEKVKDIYKAEIRLNMQTPPVLIVPKLPNKAKIMRNPDFSSENIRLV